MSPTDAESLFRGYRTGARLLHVSATDLRLARGWNAYGGTCTWPSADEPLPEPATWQNLLGTAHVDRDDGIVVVGSEQKPIKQLSFELYPFADWESLSQEWESYKEKWTSDNPLKHFDETSNDEEARYLCKLYREFDARPPTSVLVFLERDWEIGTYDDTWSLSCKVPKVVFDALVSDLCQGRCRRLGICIELVPTLVSREDEHMPLSAPITFGMLRSGITHGWVLNISWTPVDKPQLEVVTGSADAAEDDFANQEPGQFGPQGQSLSESAGLLNNEIHSLVAAIRLGFIVVFFLIALMEIIHLLRA